MHRVLAVLLLLLPAAGEAADLHLGPRIPVAPLAIGAAPYSAQIREIVPTGNGYVAFWRDQSTTIFATRLDADGRPAGNAVALETSEKPLWGFDVARRGDGFLLVWSDFETTKAVFLDGELRALRPPTILQQRYFSDVACGSERCVIAHADYGRAFFLFITDLDGVAWESRLFTSTAESSIVFPKLAASAEGFGITAVVRNALEMIVLDRRGTEISRRYVGATAFSADIATRGQEYVVGWLEQGAVLGASFDLAGAPLLPPRRIDTPRRPVWGTIEVGTTRNETLFVVPRNFTATLITGTSPPDHLYAIMMDARLESARTTLLTDADHHSWGADIATNGRGFLAAWNSYALPGYSPPVARIAAVGAQAAALSDAAGPAISFRYGPLDQTPAGIAMAGDVSLAVYLEADVGSSRLYGVRVRRGGEVLDRMPLLLATGLHLRSATVSTDGRDFLVASVSDWAPDEAPPVTTLFSVDAISGAVRATGTLDSLLSSAPVWSGSTYLAMTSGSQHQRGALVRIAADGSVLSKDSMEFPPGPLALAGGRVAANANHGSPTFEPILFDEATGRPSGRMMLPQPSGRAQLFGGHRTFLMLYTQRTGPLQATRVDLDGRPLDVRADGSTPLLFMPQHPTWYRNELHVAPVGPGWLVAAQDTPFAAVQQFFADGTPGEVLLVSDDAIAGLASTEGRAALLCSTVDTETGVRRAVIREVWFDPPRQRPLRR